MDRFFYSISFEDTVKDFEFTKKAVSNINKVVNSFDFDDMDSELIFTYLFKEMQMVSFKDYLKRYLYERAEISEPFSEVGDAVYQDIIMSSFEENSVPHAFEPTTKRWSAAVKAWLSQDSVKRDTIFLLGFGLNMDEADVSDFLVRVLKETDYDFCNAKETIFWYCFRNHLSYRKAQDFWDYYNTERTSSDKNYTVPKSGKEAESLLISDKVLKEYLDFLRNMGVHEDYQRVAMEEFDRLIGQSRAIIAGILQEDKNENGKSRKCTPEMVTYGDIEKIICCGIPTNESGNLKKMSASLLNKQFHHKRLSRQRMESISAGKIPVERFDLITLGFFIYSQAEHEDPVDQTLRYLDEINAVLLRCGMTGIHPTNPYESFILMCMLSEHPLGTYADIWERSYQDTGI